jgi:SagB-type dehydrogenase family enzyme
VVIAGGVINIKILWKNLAGHSLKLANNPSPRKQYKLTNWPRYKTIEKIILKKPQKNKYDAEFFKVINNRRSYRTFLRGLDVEELSELLWFLAKVHKITIDSYKNIIEYYSNTPSSGALKTIDIFIIDIKGLSDNLFYYNAIDHSLDLIESNHEDTKQLRGEVKKVLDYEIGTILIFGAYLKNIKAKYEHPENLVWRDSGAYYASTYLVAEALDIGCCGLGIIFEPFLSNILKNKITYGVGGVVLGKKIN